LLSLKNDVNSASKSKKQKNFEKKKKILLRLKVTDENTVGVIKIAPFADIFV
jgi:hypothetical protein